MVKNAYFFLRPQGPPEESAYQHCALALAEGLGSIGVACYANRQYWTFEGRSPFRLDPEVRPADCGVAVWGDNYPLDPGPVDEVLRSGCKTVYVDSSDGWRTQAESPEYRRFSAVLRAHCNAHYRYPPNVHPWAFGLTDRIIRACESPTGAALREAAVVANFRVGHPVRRVAERRIMPLVSRRFAVDRTVDEGPPQGSGVERFYWEATGRRHHTAFFDRLRRSQACAAFGGFFAPGRGATTESLSERALCPRCACPPARSCSTTAGGFGNQWPPAA